MKRALLMTLSCAAACGCAGFNAGASASDDDT